MCGRYALTLPPEAVRSYFGYADRPNFPPRYNIAPTQPVPILRLHEGVRRFELVRWGFVPGFVKDLKSFPLIINARAEGIEAKPSFRAAFRRRRCLFMADAFYEWRREGKVKQPFMIRRPDGGPIAFAGLWECWNAPDGGEIDTACIITCAANATVGALHDRMPVVLDPDRFDAWLDPGLAPEAALSMLRPAEEDALVLVRISRAVNAVGNDGPEVQRAEPG